MEQETWVEDKLPKYLDQDQVAAILQAAKKRSLRDYVALAITYKYGLRVSELVRMDKSDVRFDSWRIRIRRSKGSRSGELPLFKDLAGIVREYFTGRVDTCPAAIRGRRGRLSTRQMERVFAATARAASVELRAGQNVHCLRHSIAVHLLDAGRDVREVQDWLGHRSITSTMVYAQISERRRAEMVRAIETDQRIVQLDNPPPATSTPQSASQ